MDRPPDTLGLDAGQLARLFPFHIVVDGDGCITQVGVAWATMCEFVCVGAEFGALFDVDGHSGAEQYAHLAGHMDELLIVRCRSTRGRFSGQIVAAGSATGPDARLILLISPIIEFGDGATDLSATLAQLPLHDRSQDLAMMVRVQQQALEEFRAMNGQLTQQRAELAEAARTLESREELLLAVFRTAVDAVIVMDRHGIIEMVNRSTERMFGYSRTELVGLPVKSLMPVDVAREHDGYLQRYLAGGSAGIIGRVREVTARRVDGSEFPAELAVSALRADGVVRFAGMIRDVTDRRETARALAEARELEIETGARIQQALLLAAPPERVPGLAVAARSIPCQAVGGDYLDFVQHRNGAFDVLVGDVMGKGVPAALLAAGAKSQFQRTARALSGTFREVGRLAEPEEVIGALHAELTPRLMDLGSFLTLCYSRFDPHAGTVTVVDAGHPPALLYHAGTGDCELLTGRNVPLGFLGGEIYHQQVYRTEPGDMVLFYSDAISEARGPLGEMMGVDRLRDTCSIWGAMDPVDAVAFAVRLATDFGGDPPMDDLTCVAVKVVGSGRPRPKRREMVEIPSSPDQLEWVRGWIRSGIGELLGEVRMVEMELAVQESLVNVMEHSYGGATDHRIQLAFEVYADEVRVELYDTGRPFDPSEVLAPAFDGSRDGGFGLFITEQCTDGLERNREPMGRNCLTLIKKIGVDHDTE